jgi:hypothetical protein
MLVKIIYCQNKLELGKKFSINRCVINVYIQVHTCIVKHYVLVED